MNNIFTDLKHNFAIDEKKWQECLAELKDHRGSLVKVLTAKGLAEEKPLLEFLSEKTGLLFKGSIEAMIEEQAVSSVSAKAALHYNFMPLYLDKDMICLAIHDPLDTISLDEIGLLLKKKISFVLTLQKNIIDAARKFYGLGAETLESLEEEKGPELEIERGQNDEDIDNSDIDPSVIKFFNQILADAITQRATDIHLEPFEDDLRIRYRIDGMLHEVSSPQNIKNFQSSIASRIKVMANLDIAEKRRPQDGRVKVKMAGAVYDLRVSILPAPFGESIVIRILSRTSPVIGLRKLGLTEEGFTVLERMIEKPHGIILVTGPTGSGKTTTLYSCLNKINSPQRKILTIEEPIEYQLSGITQMQAEPKIGFTFASALRSMLRHDPDVMMVGEIRDTETARLAVRTALTGHLVFSTLHTNDSASSITRLMDMEIDPYLVASSVILIIAQRLVRNNCPHCLEEYIPEEEILNQFSGEDRTDVKFFHGTGCEQCRHTGYLGRSAIFEILEVNDEIREMTLKRMPAHLIKQKAVSSGMSLLRHEGWLRVKEGKTTAEEVLRVTQEERV